MIASDSRIHPSRVLGYPASVVDAAVVDVVAADAVVAPTTGSARIATPVPVRTARRTRRARRD
jgi:hypothetical protein